MALTEPVLGHYWFMNHHNPNKPLALTDSPVHLEGSYVNSVHQFKATHSKHQQVLKNEEEEVYLEKKRKHRNNNYRNNILESGTLDLCLA